MGDSQALDYVLSTIRPVVVRYCRARVGRRDQSFTAADEVAKLILHAVLIALPGERRPMLAVAYGIAVRKVDTALAGYQGRVEAGPDVLVPWLLDELPKVQREIIVLRVAVGLSADQVAQAIGRTPSFVRLAQHRALTQLRQFTDVMDTVPIQTRPTCPTRAVHQ